MAQTHSGALADPDREAATLLLVEDEVLIRLTVADYLRDCGYHVIEASNAQEALSVLTSDIDIDIVFSDVQMPGTIDGFGLARWGARSPPGRARPPDVGTGADLVRCAGLVRARQRPAQALRP